MKEVMKEASTMFVGLIFLFASTISYMLLAFAFRDFSLILLIQFILTPVGIPLGFHLLQKGARGDFKKKPMAFSTKIATITRELEELSNI
jgi:hypothetical protein